MNNQETFIQYSLPDSRIGQAVREKGIEMAWLKIEFFIRQFTTALPESPDDSRWDAIELHIFSGFEDLKTDDKCWTAINSANQKFGEGQIINVQQPQLYDNPPKKETIWRLKKETFKDAIDLLISGDPWPKQQLGPVELMFSYDFHLKDNKSKKILDGSPFQSGIMFWLTRTSFCSPTLNFPFQNADESFWDYVKEMEPYMPFKFDKKYLRLVTKNKKGTGYKWRKL
ncbi:hypothetical protein [Chryseolinea sp. H1M3-3]|uniref:hypothetical protein n=1 Tax=Chryseolinea sp. H1M3-3 TaxID=3034144 RepID=UPI0023EA8064|nr:hypothetical protein [Chryseolinea sp. H1M3-3]